MKYYKLILLLNILCLIYSCTGCKGGGNVRKEESLNRETTSVAQHPEYKTSKIILDIPAEFPPLDTFPNHIPRNEILLSKDKGSFYIFNQSGKFIKYIPMRYVYENEPMNMAYYKYLSSEKVFKSKNDKKLFIRDIRKSFPDSIRHKLDKIDLDALTLSFPHWSFQYSYNDTNFYSIKAFTYSIGYDFRDAYICPQAAVVMNKFGYFKKDSFVIDTYYDLGTRTFTSKDGNFAFSAFSNPLCGDEYADSLVFFGHIDLQEKIITKFNPFLYGIHDLIPYHVSEPADIIRGLELSDSLVQITLLGSPAYLRMIVDLRESKVYYKKYNRDTYGLPSKKFGNLKLPDGSKEEYLFYDQFSIDLNKYKLN